MRLIFLVLVIAVVLLIPTLIVGDSFDIALGGERALEFIRAQGSWAGLVGVGLIVADLFVPIPSPAIIASLGLIYGPLVGGAVAGDTETQRVRGFFERYGPWAIALSRWLPAVPELLAYLAGLTRMSFARFSIGNAIGSLGVGFAYAYFGSRGEGDPAKALAAAAILPYLALPFFFALIVGKSGAPRREQTL